MIKNIEIRKAIKEDIPGVLRLQSKYLATNLSEEEKKEGFVTTPFTTLQIEEIIKLDGLFIAISSGKVVSYLFAANWNYFDQWPIFRFMTDRFPNLSFDNTPLTRENTFEYGPICIEKEFRGTGLLHEIFEVMRLHFKKLYPISITFINKVNSHSTYAHTKKLKWEIIEEFEFNDNIYISLGFNMENSVLGQ